MNNQALVNFTICLKEQSLNTSKRDGIRNKTKPELEKIEMEVWDGIEGVTLDLTLADLKALRRNMKTTINEVEAWR